MTRLLKKVLLWAMCLTIGTNAVSLTALAGTSKKNLNTTTTVTQPTVLPSVQLAAVDNDTLRVTARHPEGQDVAIKYYLFKNGQQLNEVKNTNTEFTIDVRDGGQYHIEMTVFRSAGYSDYISNTVTLDGTLKITATDNLTMMATINPRHTYGNQIIMHTGKTGGDGYGLMLRNGKLSLLLGGKTVATGLFTLPANQWSHVYAERVNGQWRVYYNGFLDPFLLINTAPNAPTVNMIVGQNNGGGERFSGEVKNPMVLDFTFDSNIRLNYTFAALGLPY